MSPKNIPPVPVLFLISMSLMAVWPAIGSGLSFYGGLIEKSSEYGMLFGGITLFALFPFALVTDSELFYIAAILAVWCVVLITPTLLLRSIQGKYPGQEWGTMLLFFGFQFALSCGQAAMGLLLRLGKNV